MTGRQNQNQGASGNKSQSYFTTLNDFDSIPQNHIQLQQQFHLFSGNGGAMTERTVSNYPPSSQLSSRKIGNIPGLITARGMSGAQQYKDTIITTSSNNLLSDRTLNLKKEIVNLDEEIVQLQNSLQSAMVKRTGMNSAVMARAGGGIGTHPSQY